MSWSLESLLWLYRLSRHQNWWSFLSLIDMFQPQLGWSGGVWLAGNSICVLTNDGGAIIEFMLILNNHYDPIPSPLLLFVYICWSRDHISDGVKDVICRLWHHWHQGSWAVVECEIGLERLESVSYSSNDLGRWWRHTTVPGTYSNKSTELSLYIYPKIFIIYIYYIRTHCFQHHSGPHPWYL